MSRSSACSAAPVHRSDDASLIAQPALHRVALQLIADWTRRRQLSGQEAEKFDAPHQEDGTVLYPLCEIEPTSLETVFNATAKRPGQPSPSSLCLLSGVSISLHRAAISSRKHKHQCTFEDRSPEGAWWRHWNFMKLISSHPAPSST